MTAPTWADVKNWVSSKTRVTDSGCWEWTGNMTAAGYGRLWGDMAHRLSYQAHVGPIGKGLDLDHLCRNRACVNPSHLEPVTRRENLARGEGIAMQKKRAAEKTVCSEGHPLTEDNVYVRPSDGVRTCRICRSDRDVANRKKNRDAINARKRAWRQKWRAQGIRK